MKEKGLYKRHSYSSLILGLFVWASVLLFVSPVFASHFRFAHITWEPRPDIGPTTAEFTFTVAFSRSSFVGTAPDGRLQTGDIMKDWVGGTTMRFGDGTGSGFTELDFEVVAYNDVEDWVLVKGELIGGPDKVILHDYPSATAPDGTPWIAEVFACCRIFDVNNPSLAYRILASVELGTGNSSPISNLSPVVTCIQGTTCSFLVPGADVDGDLLHWRLSTSLEATCELGCRVNGIFTQPGPPFSATPLAVDANGGNVTWTTESTTPVGFYSAQVTLEDRTPGGDIKSTVAIDFLINLTAVSVNNPPIFDIPPTPPSTPSLIAPPDVPLVLSVQASDPDVGGTVTLNHTGLPPGATFTSPSAANPAVGTFSWTPTGADTGVHIVTFTATDEQGLSAPPHSVLLEVRRPVNLTDVRIIDTISTASIDLDSTSFSTPPFSITVLADRTVIEWQFNTFSMGQIENLSFDVILKNPLPGEDRLVNHSLEILYTDVNGNPVRTEFGPQFVNVLASAFTTAVSTDKVQYTATENVLIDLSITNLSGFARTVDTVVEIEDSLGKPVHTITALAAEAFLAGETKIFPGLIFDTGSTFAGDYRVHVRLIEVGVDVGEAFANFTITPVIQAASKIVTDKISFSSNETVTLSSSVTSQSPNATLTNLDATVTVSDSLGTLLFTETRALANLLPGAGFSYNAFFNTSTLPAGLYTATLQVNTNGVSLTTSTADFEIISSLQQADALSGTLAVNPGSIFETESTTLTYTIQNTGNEFDLPLILIEILVVDPDSQLPVRTLTDQMGLNGREVFINSILFDSEGLETKDYLLVLRGTTAGITQTLDSAGLQVKPIPNTAPTANAGVDQHAFTGQVVLLDGSLSSDDEGDLLTFNWDFASKPATSILTQASIANNGSSAPTFIPDVEGVYIMSLVVNDGLLDSAIDTVSVFVNPAPDVDIHPEVINLKSKGGSTSITGVLSSPALSAFEFFTAADGLTVTATFRIENTYVDKNGTTVVYPVPADVYPGDDTVVPTDTDLDGVIDQYQLTLKFNRDLIIAGVNDINQQLLITQPTDLISTVIATVGGVDIVVGSDTNIMIHPPAVTLGGPP